VNILVRTPRAAAGLRVDIKVALHDVDASIPPPDIHSYDELLSQSISDRRLVMGLLGGFSVLALFLAGLGIYSVIAYGVAQRTSEFGVRLALGAEPSALLLLVLREGLKLTLIGLGIGLVASVLLTRLLHSLLFEVSATDPVVLGGVSLFLALVALVACWLPARRAAKVDPMVALRTE
jgi:ABC-type antimicrobial peptide transport system permease subunit